MTTPTRNQIFTALLALTANLNLGSGNPDGKTGFVVRSRKLRHFAKQTRQDSPALFQVEPREKAAQKTGLGTLRTLHASWVIYFATDANNPNDVGIAQIDDILDALDAAIAPPPGSTKQSLGGLVHHAFVDGEIDKIPGDDDGQGMIIVPLSILVP
jgi:hypothetical protein